MWKFPFYNINEDINWQKIEAEFDWFRDMQGVQQSPIWHAEGDVFIHTKMVINSLLNLPEFQQLSEQEKQIVFTACLLHDVEKRSTTVQEIIDGLETYVSPKHAKKGEFTTRKILYQDIKTPFEIREQICKLVRHHGLPLWAFEKKDPTKEVIKSSLFLNTKLLAIVAKADVLGRICQDQAELLIRIELFEEICRENDCWGNPKQFNSDHGRYFYLNKHDALPEYEPYSNFEFEVIMMCALPGSGKDTYIKENLDLPMLSLDDIRRENHIDPTDKKKTSLVVQFAKDKVKEYLRAKKSFVFNATNISRNMRGRWLSMFHDYGARVKIIYVEVSFSQLLAQNKKRQYDVPEKIIDKLLNQLEIPSYDEAHEIEYIVNNE
jgi:predicted kinase